MSKQSLYNEYLTIRWRILNENSIEGEIMELTAYQQKLAAWLDEYRDFVPAQNRIRVVQQILAAIKQHELPDQLISLEFSETELVDNLGKYPQLLTFESELLDLRQLLVEKFGIWHLFSRRWVQDLKYFINAEQTKSLELMAGNAVLTKFVPNMRATDNLDWKGQDNEHPHPWTTVENSDALVAVQKYYRVVDNIVLAWAPDQDEIDWHILQFLRQQKWAGKFIVIGEKNGATNSKAFWQNSHLTLVAELNRNHPQVDFINDQVFLVK